MLDKMIEHANYVQDVIAFFRVANIKVPGPRIAVIRHPEDEVTKGGIIIPEQAKHKEPCGTVVSVGLGVDYDPDLPPTGVSVGDEVMYTKYNPIQFFITLPDDRVAALELMHVSDVYLIMGKE